MAVDPGSSFGRFEYSCSISPKVYQLAQPVYHQFELLRLNHADVDFSSLLQLIVDLLEEMDKACVEKHEMTVEMNLHIAEKSELIFQWEKSKKLREAAEKRVNFIEDDLMESRKNARDKIESLEAALRHREMLTRNAQENANRLEEHVAQLQAELTATHERYTELLRTHVDQVERALLSTGNGGSTAASSVIGWPVKRSIGAATVADGDTLHGTGNIRRTESSKAAHDDEPDSLTPRGGTPTRGYINETNLASELTRLQNPNGKTDPSTLLLENVKASSDRVSSFIDLMDETMEYESVYAPSLAPDQDDYDDAVEFSESAIEGNDTPFSVVREIEKLITENAELCATKNALNIVKNDLIKKLDEVTGEKLVLTGEVQSLRLNRDEARDEANRLARQLHHHRNQIDSLKARMQLYESQADSLAACPSPDPPKPVAIQQATSCLALHSASTTDNCRPNASRAPVSSQRFGGSLDRLPTANDSHGQDDPSDLLAKRYAAINEYSMRHAVMVDSDASQRTNMKGAHFTKREMARIIAERNHYKERLLELQEAVRFAEELRVGRLFDENQLSSPKNHGSSSPIPPLNTASVRTLPRRNIARRIFSSLKEAASGFGELITGLEPMFLSSLPAEAQYDISLRPAGYSKSHANHHQAQSPSLPPVEGSLPSVPPAGTPSGAGRGVTQMFSHLIGHTVAVGTEAVLGTGNDFATAVSSQTLTNSISGFLNDPAAGAQPTPTPGSINSPS